MDVLLTETEVRVLGCLIEKEFSTPEYYPLSLNALVNACNQKSNREPVVCYDEKTVLSALEGLKQKQLVFQGNTARVAKYEETFLGAHNFIGSEASLLCELMVRGPQTPGELRTRAERMHAFASPEEFVDTLNKLEAYGYILRLERQPGRKESRYAHLLSGPVSDPVGVESGCSPGAPACAADAPKLAALEEELAIIKAELADLKHSFIDFKRQFE